MQPSPIILLVENEPELAVELTEVLEENGFYVRSATSGAEALTAIDSNEPFAAIVTDIDLDGAIDGWDVGRRAREHDPRTSVLYLTGNGAHAYMSRGVPHSMVLRKPFASVQLIVAVAGLLNALLPLVGG